MILLFLLLSAVIVCIWIGYQRVAIFLLILTIMLMLGIFIYHMSDALYLNL